MYILVWDYVHGATTPTANNEKKKRFLLLQDNDANRIAVTRTRNQFSGSKWDNFKATYNISKKKNSSVE